MSQTKAELIDAKGDANFDSGTLYVDASTDRVGIGTIGPVTTLDVNGDVTITDKIIHSGDTDTAIRFPAADTVALETNNARRLTVYSDGNISVGPRTTTPGELLALETLTGASLSLGHSGQGRWIVATDNANLKISDLNGEKALLDSSGRLLVGTSTSPSAGGYNQYAKLVSQGNTSSSTATGLLALNRGENATTITTDEEIGAISFGDSAGNEFAYITCLADANAGSGDYPGRLVFSTTADGASSPTERMRISANGNINLTGIMTIEKSTGIWGYNAPRSGAGSSTLKWNTGTAEITYDTSSRLVKQNIEDLGYGIETIKQLQPRRYYRIDDRKDEIGFIADEIISVIPEVVPIGPKSRITRNDDDTEEIPIAVNYDKLTAVLVKALQEAVARIETLEAEVAALKAS